MMLFENTLISPYLIIENKLSKSRISIIYSKIYFNVNNILVTYSRISNYLYYYDPSKNENIPEYFLIKSLRHFIQLAKI